MSDTLFTKLLVACPGSISGASPNLSRFIQRGLPRNPVLDRTDRGKAESSASEAQPFAAEIESLRIALQRLQHAFSCTTTIEEHLKLASAISLIYSLSRILCGASISRLVRTQNYLASNRLPEFNREINAALDVVMKEWGRT